MHLNMPHMQPVKRLSILAFLFIAGCQTHYTKLSVTDHQGARIAEWVAEGPVKKCDQGYAIHAIERYSGDTPPVYSKYPYGKRSTVVGPNITLEEVEKPSWLVELDGDAE
jgi:hypothetical protein